MTKVLYIGGYSRSGSTLVDRMLGQLPAYVSTGELGYLTTHGLEENRLCGCGVRFLECPFWTHVGQEAFGGWDTPDGRDLRRLYPEVTRHRYIPWLLVPGLRPGFRRMLGRYAELLGRLYRAIARVGGAEVVVDSTIDPVRAFVLRRVPGIDLRILHLIRDSRGTAFSWTKVLTMKDSVDEVVYKGTLPPTRVALRWMLYHLMIHGLGLLEGRELVVRYEDMVHAPRRQMRRVAAYLGGELDDRDLGFVDGGSARLAADHTAVGNDMRFHTGDVRLRVDDEWRRALPAGQRRMVTVLTWPFLRRYRYVGPASGAA